MKYSAGDTVKVTARRYLKEYGKIVRIDESLSIPYNVRLGSGNTSWFYENELELAVRPSPNELKNFESSFLPSGLTITKFPNGYVVQGKNNDLFVPTTEGIL